MVKKYKRPSYEQRSHLVSLIHEQKLSIKDAASLAGVTYANAKAINKTFVREKRIAKKSFRYRPKAGDEYVIRQDLLIEKCNPFMGRPEEALRRACGVRTFKHVLPTLAIGCNPNQTGLNQAGSEKKFIKSQN